jgi:16S rRNA (adenine1518-N6/adenine1519-N6)-dimethyltransferase
VISIEKDRFLASELRESKGIAPLPANVRLIEGDALSLDWHALFSEASMEDAESSAAAFKIVGNIPYAITAPLIEKALKPPMPAVAVYLIQREVAERLVAEPGVKAYGALTVGVRAVASAERLFLVKPGSFSPPPAVDSAVVRLVPLTDPHVLESERAEFRRFVTALFGQRRKQLSRALRTVTGLGKAEIEQIIDRKGLTATARPEVLTRDEMLTLFREVARSMAGQCDEN